MAFTDRMDEGSIYVLSASVREGFFADRAFCIGRSNSLKMAKEFKRRYSGCIVDVNNAVTCFDGQLACGDYLGAL